MNGDKQVHVLNVAKYLTLLGLLLVWPVSVHAQNQGDNKPLPGVLIIGDAVYTQHARGVASELKGEANVRFANWPKYVLPNSTNAIEHIDVLLGLKDASGNDVPEDKRPNWDLVHLNVGLGDLIYRVPKLKSHRTFPHELGGVVSTDPAQYEKNLDRLIQLIRKKAPQAKIIWASTTPIRSSRAKIFKPGMEVEYNQIAARVMKQNNVPISDMHTYAKSIMNMDKPVHADPFFFDRKPFHPPIVVSIRKALKLPSGPR